MKVQSWVAKDELGSKSALNPAVYRILAAFIFQEWDLENGAAAQALAIIAKNYAIVLSGTHITRAAPADQWVSSSPLSYSLLLTTQVRS